MVLFPSSFKFDCKIVVGSSTLYVSETKVLEVNDLQFTFHSRENLDRIMTRASTDSEDSERSFDRDATEYSYVINPDLD